MASAAAAPRCDVSPFSVEIFNGLPNIHDYTREEVDAVYLGIVDRVGSVLHDARLTGDVGLTLLHNHFLLGEGEIVVTTVDAARGLVSNRVVQAPDDPDAVPFIFRLGAGGRSLEPVQFISSACPTAPVMRLRLARLVADPAFVGRLLEALKSEGHAHDVGVAVRFGDTVPRKAGQRLRESTNHAERTQLLVPTPRDDSRDVILVHFFYDESGKLDPMGCTECKSTWGSSCSC